MISDITDIAIFSDIPVDDIPRIAPLLKERYFKKNHVLMFENDESEEIYVLRSGMVKIFRVHDEKEIILGIGMPGEIFGETEALSNTKHRISSVEALTDTSTWLISRQDFIMIAETFPSVLMKAYNILAERTRTLNRLIRYLSFYDVRSKVANLLLDFYYNFGKTIDHTYVIDLKMNQTLIANMLGVTRESVSKTINDFQEEGLIDFRKKYCYILNKEKLENICYNTEEIPTLRKWHTILHSSQN